MQKVKNLFCENRGRKLAVLLLGAFGYALLTALCSQIEQFGATAWSRTLARFAAARMPKTFLHMGRGAAVFRMLYADAAHRISRFVHL